MTWTAVLHQWVHDNLIADDPDPQPSRLDEMDACQ
jgi:hypothetical protein